MVDAEEEFAWMRAIAEATGQPVTFNCLQDDPRPENWRRLIELAEQATADGCRIVPQVAGRPACLLLGWESTAHVFMWHETWQKLAHLGRAERLAALRTTEVRDAMLAEPVDPAGMSSFMWQNFGRIYPLGDPPEYEPAPDTSLAAVASRTGRRPEEIAYDAMTAQDGRGLLYWPVLGYSHGDFDALHEMLVHPGTVLGLGDGGAHCGLLCDASLPSYMLSHWTRDRSRGERLGLEHAVRLQTRQTAELYGFLDRGLLRPGLLADVNVVDYDGLGLLPPEMVYDLPAGGRRLIQRATGYGATIKRGRVVLEDDHATGERPGVLLRGPQPASTPTQRRTRGPGDRMPRP
jgi:N-acyl-D-aspartate/D-glutamate deacylase